MKVYTRLFNESLDFRSGQEVKDWVLSLSIPKRKPQNISKIEHEVIVGLYQIAITSDYKFDEKFRNSLLMSKLSQLRLSKEKYEEIYNPENEMKQPKKIKGKYATYVKEDMGSYKRFLDNIEDIESFLSTLKGYHKIPIKNLTIEFVSSKDMKVPAQYKSDKKIMWINPLSKKVGKTKEEYGSLRYIVLHELGHRFLDMNPQSWNIADTSLFTTPYSKRNSESWAEEESFAELFALSHWKNKYREYKDQIAEFEKRLEL